MTDPHFQGLHTVVGFPAFHYLAHVAGWETGKKLRDLIHVLRVESVLYRSCTTSHDKLGSRLSACGQSDQSVLRMEDSIVGPIPLHALTPSLSHSAAGGGVTSGNVFDIANGSPRLMKNCPISHSRQILSPC